MALLQSLETGACQPLPARLLVGRSRVCGLRLRVSEVSGEHASLRWEGGAWVLRDLGSRNGTWVGERRVGVGESVRLADGDELRFAGSQRWRLVGAGAPEPSVRLAADASEVIEGSDGLLALPDAESPTLTVYRDSLGWQLERGKQLEPVHDGDALELDGRRWILSLPGELPSTAELGEGELSLARAGLRFCVSQDEEHIELSLTHPRGAVDLGARSHHVVLLQLARLRLADREAGLAASEEGWVYVDILGEQLGLDPPYVNVLVFRARKQLAKLGVIDAATIVERRPGTGQLRLGLASLEL